MKPGVGYWLRLRDHLALCNLPELNRKDRYAVMWLLSRQIMRAEAKEVAEKLAACWEQTAEG